MPDLLMQGKKHLHSNIYTYNKSVKKQALQMPVSEKEAMQICQGLQVQELDGLNENVDELFS